MKKKMRRSKKREAKKEQKFSSNFLFLFAPLNTQTVTFTYSYIIYISRLALRTEREGKEEGKEIDGIGGRRGDVDHARVFVLRE